MTIDARRRGGRSAVPDTLRELAATAAGQAHRPDPALPRTGGPAGNARLTSWTGLLLLGLFAVEGVTLLALGALVGVHIAVGALLVPVVLLKTATTTYRMVRYYLGDRAYRTAGPPPLVLRVLGPLVVFTGVAVLGSGLALVPLGPAGTFRPLVTVAGVSINALTLHQASFVGWLVVTGVHVLARTVPALRLSLAPGTGRGRVAGGWARLLTLGTALVAGAAVAVAVLGAAAAWTGGGWHHHDDEAVVGLR